MMPVSYFIGKQEEKMNRFKSRFKSEEMRNAYEAGGFRERYAMEHGNRSVIYENGHKCFRFTYSRQHEYQDANGATYDTVRGEWVN